MSRYLNVFAMLALAVAGAVQADDSMRCNSALISVNDTMGEVLRKCGEPSGRGPVSYIRANVGGGRQATLPVEQWTYGPTNGMYHYLRFEGDRLVSIGGDRG